MKHTPPPAIAEVDALLSRLHGTAVAGLEPLAGGFWSSAYGYRADGRDLVVRLGTIREGFEMDRHAMAFDGPDLPVPAVLDVGEALGAFYAISERRQGRFLETIDETEADAVAPAVMRMLAALRAVPAEPDSGADWYSPGEPSTSTWRGWLAGGLVDRPEHPTSGWRSLIAAEPSLDQLLSACERRIGELIDACPERRDLVHGDLLHGNVLVSDDAAGINAVFSWKCSVRGDFLFDVAWCTFWGGSWHPSVAAIDVWARIIEELSATGGGHLLDDAAIRHHCYELQIGATHLGWCAWKGDTDDLARVAAHTAMILERGPLTL